MAVPFSLKPFEPVSDLVISGRAVRSQSSLMVEYTLTGAVDTLKVPPTREEIPGRHDHLWEHTCFEVFIGLSDSPKYWEVNAAPNGDWNVYQFEDYRQDMTTELACHAVEITWLPLTKGYCLTLELSIDSWLPLDQPLKLGISSILETNSISHWALVHPEKQPDFHHRDSFNLVL